MGYAKHIGRVGGLAVALGVGVAVATSPAVAWADGTGSTASADSSADSTTAGSATDPAAPGPTTTSTSSTSTSAGVTAADSSAPKVTYDSSGGALTSNSGGAGPSDNTASEKTTAAKPKTMPKAGHKTDSYLAASPAPKGPTRLPVTPQRAIGSETTASSQHIDTVNTAAGQLTKPVVASKSSPPDEVPAALVNGPASGRAVQALDSAPAAPNSAVSRRISTMLSWVGWAPSADGTDPQLPPESPLVLAGLAVLRRQTQQASTGDESLKVTAAEPSQTSLIVAEPAGGEPMLMAAALTTNSAPTVPTQRTGIPDPATGVVSGAVVASDADGNTLTYSTTGTSVNGGTVAINSATGAYTYTPTPAQRLAAGTTAAGDIDTFTVTVSDGQSTTTATVPVYVSPTQLNVGTPIAVGNQPDGVAVYGTKTYVINQYDKTVSVIDTNSNSTTYNQVVATIKLASSPSDIAISPDGTRAYVTTKGNASVAVINTATNTVVTNVRVGSTPLGVAVSPDGKRVYVTNGGSSTVSVIAADTVNNTYAEVSRIKVGSQPSGIAVSPDGTRLYVTLRYTDSLATVNLANNALTTVKVGDSPRDVALTPDGTRAFVTNYDGTVTVIDTTTNTRAATITTGGPKYQPVGVAISPDGSLAYVANGKDTVSVFNTKTNTIVQTITVDSAPESGQHWVALSPDGTHIYVTDYNDDKLRVLTLARGNTAPVAIADPTVGTPNVYTGEVSGLVNIKDPDGDPLAYTFATQGSGTVTYDATTDTYTYTPTAAARQQASYNPGLTDNITVHATDPSGAFKDVIITVPISGNFNPATGVTTGTVNIGGNNKYYVTSTPTYGSLALDENTGNFTYTSYAPNDGYYALWYDSFSWKATDGQSTTTGAVTVDTYVDPYILYGYTW